MKNNIFIYVKKVKKMKKKIFISVGHDRKSHIQIDF